MMNFTRNIVPQPLSESNSWPAWPAFGLNDDIRPALLQAKTRSTAVAMVTLFRSEGGSPRGVGAQMAVGQDILAGHVSGGCIESDVALHCREVLTTGTHKVLVYGRGGPWDLPLPCGGRIELLIEPVPASDSTLDTLIDFAQRRLACAWITDGQTRQCVAFEEANLPGHDEAGVAGNKFFKRYVPRIRLIVVGNDPSAMAIAAMGATMDMDVVLVRPQGPTEPPPLAEVRYSRQRPMQALQTIGIDEWTCIATCTHDHDLDNETLVAALRSPAFFVGALGSERRRGQRLDALRSEGVSEQQLARLNTPIGLPIGARAPWEIAVASLADIVRASRSKPL